MRTLYQVIALVCILHVLAAAGLTGWLGATGRLNRQRLAAVAAVFKPTIAEQKAQEKKAAELARQARAQAERVTAMMTGSTAERLTSEQRQHELALRHLERTRREIESLRANLELSRQMMEKQKQAMLTEKQGVERRLQEIEKQLNDKGFKRSIELIEQLPAEQVKRMFLEMMAQKQMDQVVSYLEAMQPRKAAAVLREFGPSSEIPQVVELTERLRARGSDLVKHTEHTG